MKRFSNIVNIIPVIGKVDTLCHPELQLLKNGVTFIGYFLDSK
jgi:septin family protein